MAISTTVNKSAEGIQEMLKQEEQEIIILPFSKYESLLQQLEDMQDLQDHKEAMQEYQKGEGRSFREFLSSYKGEFDVQS